MAAHAAQLRPREPRIFRLWPEHVEALRLWQSVDTQMRWSEGIPTGLDYWGVRCSPAFRRLPRERRELVFEEVCVMEHAWLPARLERIAEQRRRAQQQR